MSVDKSAPLLYNQILSSLLSDCLESFSSHIAVNQKILQGSKFVKILQHF